MKRQSTTNAHNAQFLIEVINLQLQTERLRASK